MNPGQNGRPFFIFGIALLVLFFVSTGLVLYGIFSAAQYPWNKIGQASAALASRSGLSIYLVKGLVIIASIPYFYAWSKLLPTSWKAIVGFSGPAIDPLFLFRDQWGWIIVCYLGLFYIAMSAASREAYFYKFCADTPDGVYMADSSGVDPQYGIPLKRCSESQIETKTHPTAPKELPVEAVKALGFFNISGHAQVWYTRDDSGGYRFFDRSGFNAEGDKLQPVTRDVAARWLREQRQLALKRESAVSLQREQSEQQQQQQLAADVKARAQQQLQEGAFEQAIESCKAVLKTDPADNDCQAVQHEASAKLAERLVNRAQAELQRGELIDATRDATHANKLDPSNQGARNVLTVANRLKSQDNR